MTALIKYSLVFILLISLIGCNTSKHVVTDKRFQKRKLNSGVFMNFGTNKTDKEARINIVKDENELNLYRRESEVILVNVISLDTILNELNKDIVRQPFLNEWKRNKEYLKTRTEQIGSTAKPLLEFRNKTQASLLKRMKPKKTQDEMEWAIFFGVLTLIFGIFWGLFVRWGEVVWANIFLVLTIACLSLAVINFLAGLFILVFFG